ncbi:MAG: hypothetical protein LBH98_10130 [Chitinispirillales bacterium]|jgi:hypothetical protein|nr:hypothetical protein [Chitinispirillales bacterium]
MFRLLLFILIVGCLNDVSAKVRERIKDSDGGTTTIYYYKKIDKKYEYNLHQEEFKEEKYVEEFNPDTKEVYSKTTLNSKTERRKSDNIRKIKETTYQETHSSYDEKGIRFLRVFSIGLVVFVFVVLPIIVN